jgi:hypothetical protein
MLPVRHAAGAHRFLHRRVHRVELMVARDDLVQRARVRVFLEDDEMLQQVEKRCRSNLHTLNHS